MDDLDAIDDLRRTSFDGRADQYDAIRPGYPDALIDEVVALAGLAPGAAIVEVGAGTGKATLPFARRGFPVTAIEPSGNMAAVLRRHAAGLPVEIVETTFEAWVAPPRFDLLLSAQAFHWVNPSLRYPKAAATLAPGGALALLRNDKAELAPAMRAGLDRAYAEHFPDALPSRTIADITGEIDASGCFGPVEVRSCPWTATYRAAEYVALLDTYSDHAVQPAARRRALYAAITTLIEREGGAITIPYVAVLHLARPRPRDHR